MGQHDIVQYVVVRKDLIKELGWPLGSSQVIAQGVHAAVAATWSYHQDQLVQKYCFQEMQQMRTIVLQVPNEFELLNLVKTLENADVKYCLWTEQPEGIPTAVATKEQVEAYFKKLSLCK
eukprot:jgi/Galph1/4533/GphlegSOOS_G3205.1